MIHFDTSAPVLWVFGGLLLLLAVASAVTLLLRRARPTKDYTELTQRVNSWWIMIGIFAFALVTSVNVAIGFFAFLSFLALKEYLSLIPTRRADRRVLFWCYFAIPLQFWWVHERWYHMFIVWVPVWMVSPRPCAW